MTLSDGRTRSAAVEHPGIAGARPGSLRCRDTRAGPSQPTRGTWRWPDRENTGSGDGQTLVAGSEQDVGMNAWEYMIIALPEFEAPTASREPSDAVRTLNDEGARGWEAVGMTVLAGGRVAVLCKRALPDNR